MAGSDMKNLEASLGILQNYSSDLDFLRLVRLVIAETGVDEATAKALILRLNFEGKVGIDLDWSVHLVPAESQAEDRVVAQIAAA
jgi:hypothetical protein